MADRPDPEVIALRAELATLRDFVAALETEVRGAQGRVDLSMRNQHRCRACGCRRIAHALSILDRADGDTRKQMALYQGSWWSRKTQGELEAYVCTKCGLVEWWVKDPGGLQAHEDYLRITDHEPDAEGGPYR